MKKIGQNPKIGQFWRPVAPQTYVVPKSRQDQRNSLALGLQNGVNSISLQCIQWPVACSEWSACLTDFDRSSTFRFFGKMTPKVKIFEMSFRIHRRDTGLRFVAKFGENRPLRSCRKVVWITTQKNTGPVRFVPAPSLPKMGRSRPKYPERCDPLTRRRVYRIWFGSAALCRTSSGKNDFFRTEK